MSNETPAVRMVLFVSCTQCARYFTRIQRAKRRFLEQRQGLMRCRGCVRLREEREKDAVHDSQSK
jgi:hypothetical protein